MIADVDASARPAELRDAKAIAAIFNEGIEDRVATFETEPREAGEIARLSRIKTSQTLAGTCRAALVGRRPGPVAGLRDRRAPAGERRGEIGRAHG